MDTAIHMHNEMVRLFNDEVNRQNHQRFVEQSMRRHRSSGSSRRVAVRHLVSKEEAKSFLVAMMKNRLPKSFIEKIKEMGFYADYVDCYEWCCVEDTLSAQIERCQSFMDKTVRYMNAHR